MQAGAGRPASLLGPPAKMAFVIPAGSCYCSCGLSLSRLACQACWAPPQNKTRVAASLPCGPARLSSRPPRSAATRPRAALCPDLLRTGGGSYRDVDISGGNGGDFSIRRRQAILPGASPKHVGASPLFVPDLLSSGIPSQPDPQELRGPSRSSIYVELLSKAGQ